MEGEISRVFPPKTKKKKAEKNYTLKKKGGEVFFFHFFFSLSWLWGIILKSIYVYMPICI